MAQIFDYFQNIDTDQIKMISFILSLVFGILFAIIVMKINKLNKRKLNILDSILTPPPPSQTGVMARWEEILRHADSPKEFEWKFAVIESDKLADDMLKAAGYQGETMGERLLSIDKSQFENLDGLWEAHKLRNKVVHDTNYFVRYGEARQAIEYYEKALKELGVL